MGCSALGNNIELEFVIIERILRTLNSGDMVIHNMTLILVDRSLLYILLHAL